MGADSGSKVSGRLPTLLRRPLAANWKNSPAAATSSISRSDEKEQICRRQEKAAWPGRIVRGNEGSAAELAADRLGPRRSGAADGGRQSTGAPIGRRRGWEARPPRGDGSPVPSLSSTACLRRLHLLRQRVRHFTLLPFLGRRSCRVN